MDRVHARLGTDAGARPEPYRRRPGDPVQRVLRVYTQDPGTSRSDGAIAEVELPWEPVGPGPTGHIFVVRDVHKPTGDVWAPIDLDDFRVTVDKGLPPSTTNPRFAQQMTYAVAMSTYERFRMALGRLPEFAPAVRRQDRQGRIEIRPHWDHEDNAYYEPDEAALSFGYVTSSARSRGATQPGAYVFTCLSHDVIAHETSHAMLDGMRPHLMRPSNPDVAAFHEGFSDLVALLMRFRYRDVVRRGLEESKDETLDSALLTEMARQWGRTDGDGQSPLRRILYRQGPPDEPVPKADRYDKKKEHHDLGAVLVAAVFEAMSRIFRKQDEDASQDRRAVAGLARPSDRAADGRGARPRRPVPEHHHPRRRLLSAGRHHLRRIPARAGHRRLGHGAGRSLPLSRSAGPGVPALRHHGSRRSGSLRGGAALEGPGDRRCRRSRACASPICVIGSNRAGSPTQDERERARQGARAATSPATDRTQVFRPAAARTVRRAALRRARSSSPSARFAGSRRTTISTSTSSRK